MNEFDPEISLSSFKSKLNRLISLYEQAKVERNELLKQVEQLNGALKEKEIQLAALEDKNRKLQVATAFKASSTDARDAKLKIGRIVREIDQCIALLNK